MAAAAAARIWPVIRPVWRGVDANHGELSANLCSIYCRTQHSAHASVPFYPSIYNPSGRFTTERLARSKI